MALLAYQSAVLWVIPFIGAFPAVAVSARLLCRHSGDQALSLSITGRVQAALWHASQFPLSVLACLNPPLPGGHKQPIRFYAGIQGGPRLGDAEAGAPAALGGPQFARTGGLLSVVTAVVTCWLLPGMWRYDSRASRLPPAARGAGGQAEPDPVV